MMENYKNKTFIVAGAMVLSGLFSGAALADDGLQNECRRTGERAVHCSLDVTETKVNIIGREVTALTLGGSLPAPTINANVGDTLTIDIHNKLHMPTSVHWHGVLLPPEQDGVSFINTKEIKAHSTHRFSFPVVHSGTYWYHSHTGFQEPRGMLGPIVFHPEKEEVSADHDKVLVFSDWNDEDPHDTMRHLKEDPDYYARKKGSVASWKKTVENHGLEGIKAKVKGSLEMMGAMDPSDVGYDAFLANGEKTHRMSDVAPGETVKLRMINASAASYFNVEYACGPMTIVAKDGVDVVPVDVNRQRLVTAETFDVIITAPEAGRSCELRATVNDGSGYSSTMIGSGTEIITAPTLPKFDNTAPHSHDHHGGGSHEGHEHMNHEEMNHEEMNHSGHEHMDHSHMNHDSGHHREEKEPPEDMREYERLRALHPTSYAGEHEIQNVKLRLTGNMETYTWSFNDKVFSEDPQIKIKKGDIVRFTFINETMMNHPMHLHGTFFRVHNGQGEYSPEMHTVNVPPNEEVTIEFLADKSGDWPLHCHILYHMMSGMMRTVSYEDSTVVTPEIVKKAEHDTMFYPAASATIQSNMFSGEAHIGNTRHEFEIEGESNYSLDNFEAEAGYSFKLDPVSRFNPRLFIGGSAEREPEHHSEMELKGIFGIRATIPGLVETELRGDHRGGVRLKLSNEHQLTNNISANWRIKIHGDKPEKPEVSGNLQYKINNNLSVTGGCNSRFKSCGGGIKLTY
ncbi:MAG: hypothetical protein CO093_00220 [Alphaproteobacteria bacterium CG_4_9_14_3_um_filter_47_13]|nr:MAG: hypothetical protein CO093_00220 [Alphaproteobacteria bacterium CG_4_9_14_3_um_filter_47_13]